MSAQSCLLEIWLRCELIGVVSVGAVISIVAKAPKIVLAANSLPHESGDSPYWCGWLRELL
jgi:hypothetical protein